MPIFFYGCVTLDGYLAARDHSLTWLHQTGSSEETGYDSFYRSMDVTLMGRKTFQEISALEHPEEVYPTTRNYVFTHDASFSASGFTGVCGGVIPFVKQFVHGENIWVVGGNTILAPLLDADLVDELIIQIAPVLLGAGIPLFTQREALRRFRLAGTAQYGQFAQLHCVRSAADGLSMPKL